MVVSISSIGLRGLEGYCVNVEVKVMLDRGKMIIVGLPDASVKESKERVLGTLHSLFCDMSIKKVVVNLSPAEWKKTGPIYDAAMVIGVLRSLNIFQSDIPSDTAIIGAVSLAGEILPFDGLLPVLVAAQKLPFKKIYTPPVDLALFPDTKDLEIIPVSTIKELIGHLEGSIESPQPSQKAIPLIVHHKEQSFYHDSSFNQHDFQFIIGQKLAKRALEISAAGGHHLFMSGPPGCGKSMLAEAFPSILPDLPPRALLEVMSLYQLARNPLVWNKRPPFRHPHHSASSVSIIGGGSFPRPGEISLAHHGVLFLDEMAEFSKQTLDMLRQPIENGNITINRARQSVSYPSSFILIGAANPCPCGYKGSNNQYCICTKRQIQAYKQRISGPIFDRMDLVIHLKTDAITTGPILEESSSRIASRVQKARIFQKERYKSDEILNARATYHEILQYHPLSEAHVCTLKSFSQDFHWSHRVQMKVLRLARTIADLQQDEQISMDALLEACFWKSNQHHLIFPSVTRPMKEEVLHGP